MRRYLTIATATLIAAGVGIVSKVYAPLAHAAGAYGKGPGFAKQVFKENRKKAPLKALKGSPTRPVGP